MFWPTLAGGGVERIGLRVARALSEKGYSVDIVVANARGELAGGIPPGVSLVNLRIPLGSGRLFLCLFPLAQYLRTRRPDVLWSNMTEANVIAILARMAAGSRCWLIVSERNTLSVRIRGQNLRKRVLPFLVGRLYPLADRIHAVSLGVADDLAKTTGLPREQIRVVYNPDVDADLSIKAEEPVDHPWFAPGEPPVVLGVGRLVAQKDFPTLIRAFALVHKERPTRLVILGEGEERSKLEALARELGLEQDIDLPGFVENPYKYMKRAAVFVLSSRWEGFGNVLVEAMALGTPVVSTDCPNGPAEILENGKWGELVPVGETQSLASAVLRTLDRVDVVRVKGAAERADQFRVESIIREYFCALFPERLEYVYRRQT